MIVHRTAARAILLTPDQEILLMRLRPPDGGASFWITPGGGLEPGETAEQGLRRELKEELGAEGFTIGPLVWRRQHTFNWSGKRICQAEDYFVVASSRFELRKCDPVEMEVVDAMRWWTVDELAAATERLTPLSLATIVSRYLIDGPSARELEVESLFD